MKQFEKDDGSIRLYITESSEIIKTQSMGLQSVPDVGTGECTTLARVSRSFGQIEHIPACDISWSRLYAGRGFVVGHLGQEFTERLSLFVGSMFALPLQSLSVDMV